jgi:two-component system chemotaxis sensor kinase CheA
MDEIVQEFLVESYENLDQLDRDLVALEQEPQSRELLSSIFRTIHTIKGTSGFLAFGRLEAVTHVGENLLSRLRDGELHMTPATTNALLRMVDTVRALLATIESTGGEGDVDVDPAVAAVTECLEGGATEPSAEVPAEATAEVPAEEPAPTAKSTARPARARRSRASKKATEPAPSADPAPLPSDEEANMPLDQPAAESAASPVASEPAVAAAPGPEVETESSVNGAARRSAADSTIRVDVDLLDSLMRLVGELVLTRNQVVQFVTSMHDVNLLRATQRLNLIASELQEGVMKTRMQPIDHLWAKLPRVVRDLSQACDKSVELVMVGRETELDRTLLEAIKDPLTHIVRNSVDHGIETPEARAAAGKPATGVLTLKAYHQSGQVVVEVEDDGAGIDPGKVGSKAVERGLVTRDQLARMSDREVLDLVFRPGFSTAEKVSNISGRGVGMDVVRTNIEHIGGSVELDSIPGRGTTTRLTIPLTLAIVPALTVECAGERYAIPQVSLLELVFLDDDKGKAGVEDVSGAPVYRLRGNLLPLVYLDEVLGLGEVMPRDQAAYIAVLQAEDRRFGLVVDRVLNTEEIVVKSLSARLKGIGLFAGATITGDGGVALILDVQALARRSHVGAESVERASAAARAAANAASASQTERLLVVGAGEHRVAIALDMVTRLEDFTTGAIERIGGREVVQYRGQIVPIVRLAELLGGYGTAERESWPVVVYSEGGRTVALVVEQIIDIVEDAVAVRSDLDDRGLTGSAVIQERVTELLDVRQAILAADPRFYDASMPELEEVEV